MFHDGWIDGRIVLSFWWLLTRGRLPGRGQSDMQFVLEHLDMYTSIYIHIYICQTDTSQTTPMSIGT